MRDGLVTAEGFDAVVAEAARMEQNVADILVSRNLISEDYFANLAARYFGVERANLLARDIDEQALQLLPEDVARQKHVIIFGRAADGALDVAMEDPSNLETIEFLSQRLHARIRPFLGTSADLDKGFSAYGKRTSESFRKLIEDNIRESLRSKAKGAEQAATEVPIVAIIDNMISYAVSLRASDIHMEILEDAVLVRYRIDGVLHEIIRIPREVHPAVVARIKVLGGMKIDEHAKPQDGRFRYKLGSDLVDLRIAIIPTFHGEKVEMRILAGAQKPLSLRELGMLDDMVKVVEENAQKSYGMILVTGPTGSGKTTTLYSILTMLNRPEVNIVTVEDPIEYDMKYINQTQINPQAGITFANGLRAILRQDPNVIMVGEVRDEETAEISVHSALTGHLVLSSLHTNDAQPAVPRLIDMKIAPFLVAAVLNMILAQRLVRRVCTDCITSYAPDPSLEAVVQRQLTELGIETGFKLPKLLYRGRGCEACGGAGFRGRVAIFEILNVSEGVRKIIVSRELTLDALRAHAKSEGMVTMFEDGLRKAEQGMTTIEEILRVIRE